MAKTKTPRTERLPLADLPPDERNRVLRGMLLDALASCETIQSPSEKVNTIAKAYELLEQIDASRGPDEQAPRTAPLDVQDAWPAFLREEPEAVALVEAWVMETKRPVINFVCEDGADAPATCVAPLLPRAEPTEEQPTEPKPGNIAPPERPVPFGKVTSLPEHAMVCGFNKPHMSDVDAFEHDVKEWIDSGGIDSIAGLKRLN